MVDLHKQNKNRLIIIGIVALVLIFSVMVYRVIGKNDQSYNDTNKSSDGTSVTNKEDLNQALKNLKEVDTNTQSDEEALKELVE